MKTLATEVDFGIDNVLTCRAAGVDWRPVGVYFLTLLNPL
jgi:hypothetical protein